MLDVMSWWRRWFPDPYPSFEELRQQNAEEGRRRSRAEAIAEIEGFPLFRAPEAAGQRAELLELLQSPFDGQARARCGELTQEALRATGALVRPGTVEELWYLEGLFDRLLEP